LLEDILKTIEKEKVFELIDSINNQNMGKNI